MLAAFDRLAPGQTVEFTNDHEPKALRASLDQEREGIALWDVRNAGDGRWVVRLMRLPEASTLGDTPRIAFLRQQGFTRLKNLQGGILAWAEQIDPAMPKY